MRFHVVGLGSIGTLVSHHLRRALRVRQQTQQPSSSSQLLPLPPQLASSSWNDYVARPSVSSTTLHFRDQARADAFRGTTVECAGVKSAEAASGYRIEVPGLGQIYNSSHSGATAQSPCVVEALGFTSDPHAIDSLIVTTKADLTVEALEPFVHRLTPASTVVLLQNGMGLLEEVTQSFWPHKEDRPRFLVGNVTHGAWVKRQCHVVHAGVGNIWLGVPPDTMALPGADASSQPSVEPSSLPGSLAGSSHHYTLLSTLATLFSIPDLAAQLSADWPAYQVRALQKLVVNACINPLTAILDCRNGELVGDEWANEMWVEVCQEASRVFLAMALRERGEQEGMPPPASSSRSRDTADSDEDDSSPRARRRRTRRGLDLPSMADWSHLIQRPLSHSPSSSSSTDPILHPSLAPSSLLTTVRSVCRTTSHNFSSMHRDLRGPSASSPSKGPRGPRVPRRRTEMAYLNGWLCSAGREVGVDTPANDALVRLVGSLTKGGAAGRRREWGRRAEEREDERDMPQSQHQQQDRRHPDEVDHDLDNYARRADRWR